MNGLDRREAARRRTRRERRIAAAAAGVTLVLVAGTVMVLRGGGTELAADGAGAAASQPPPPPTLPGGGRVLFPDHRIVAYYGAPQDPKLGELGIGTPAEATAKLLDQADEYDVTSRRVMPALELIATIVTADPGDDGRYRLRQSAEVIDRYLAAARRAEALLILDIQPGRARFMDEVRAFEPWLGEPDVGLALDPEWSMRPGEVPGTVIGSTESVVVNRVSNYLADLVREHNLPEKLLIVHQFTHEMIRHRELLQTEDGVALVLNVDGFGDRPNKVSKYHLFADRGQPWHHGFKLFYHEDVNLMTPRAVLGLRPRPDVIIYE
ncbi:MAG: hypothetical protein QOJ13_607 [Gaiellales bacterium]|jgi:hypothetical protein|nr:hypothetical protein [Gaiellales bacterium]